MAHHMESWHIFGDRKFVLEAGDSGDLEISIKNAGTNVTLASLTVPEAQRRHFREMILPFLNV